MITATPTLTNQRTQRTGATQRTPRTTGLLGNRTASTGKGVNASSLRDTRASGQGFGSSSLRRNTAGKGSGRGFSASNLRSNPTTPPTNAAPRNAIAPFRRPQTGAPTNGSGFTPLEDPPRQSSPSSGGTIGRSGSSTQPRGIGKALRGAIGKAGLGLNAAGEVSLGLYGGGVGFGFSTSGKLDLGIGFASVTWNFQNPNESSLGFGFNTMTITGSQEGCTVTLTYKVLGQIVNTETREADDCVSPDPPGRNVNDPNNEGNPPDPGSNNDFSRTSNSTLLDLPPGQYLVVEHMQLDFKKYVAGQGLVSTGTSFLTFDTTSAGGKRGFILREGQAVRRESGTITFNKRISYQEASDGAIRAWNIDGNTGTRPGTFKRHFNNFYLHNTVTGLDIGSIAITFYNTGVTFTPEPLGNPPRSTTEIRITSSARVEISKQKSPIQPKIHTNRGIQMEESDKQQILLDRIYYMLGGDAFFESGLAIPNEFFTPEADGNSTQAKTYNEAVNLMFRTIDHRTPSQVKFPLPNGAEYTSINAEGYFADLGKNVSELLEKTNNTGKADNSEVIGYMHRVSLINIQIFNLLIKINELVKGIVGFLGIPMRETVEVVDIPFDPTMKGKLAKGFGNSGDLDKELEKLLKESNTSEEKIKETVARYASSGKIPVRVKKLRQSSEGGDFWWLLRNGLNLKK